ncbi:MAG: response regulator transcription factor [Anaerolineaceae bacterium]|nr:response regulator transcription factor [Anaerolineaceae bacterium]
MALHTAFSKREQEVIALLVQGKSNKQIGLELGISQRTVEYHITNILAKLTVSSRTEAVIKLSEGYLRETVGDSEDTLRKSAVGESSVSTDNEGKPIIKRRIPMKKYLSIFGAFALIALVYMAFRSIQSPLVVAPKDTPQRPTQNQISLPTASPTSTIPVNPSLTPAPASTATAEVGQAPHPTWMPTVISPIFPGDNDIYLPPLPLQFGAWPATGGCPNPQGLEDFAGFLPESAAEELQFIAVGTDEALRQWTDPAYWTVLINPFKGKPITQDWIKTITRVSKSPYAQLVTAQCGEDTMNLSWWVQVCPGSCKTFGSSEALMTNTFWINRKQWLIWAIQ